MENNLTSLPPILGRFFLKHSTVPRLTRSIMLALLVLGIVLFLTIVIKLAFNNFNMLVAKIHGLKLTMDRSSVWKPYIQSMLAL